MNNEIIFTRYLYIKQEVTISLFTCVLERKEEKALFWAFELFYSGFEKELFQTIWKIYYDLFHTLNPSYYAYIIKKENEWIKVKTLQDKSDIIYSIIANFFVRPLNIDIFILSKLLENSSLKNTHFSHSVFKNILQKKDYIRLSKYLFTHSSNYLDEIIKIFSEVNHEYNKMYLNKWHAQLKYSSINKIAPYKVLLANIMHYYMFSKNIEMGSNIYVSHDRDLYNEYKTIAKEDTEGNIYVDKNGIKQEYYTIRKVLPLACKYFIDEEKYLSLFNLTRKGKDLINIYYNNWEYYTRGCFVWEHRIKEHNGIFNETNKKMEFNDDNDIEEFYEEYGYEPDEQGIDVIGKTLQKIIVQRTWKDVYEKYKGIINLKNDDLLKINNINY